MPINGATATDESLYSGQCGDNVYWSFYTGSGTLSITGEGEMYDYSSSSSIPWLLNNLTKKIKSVEIADTITYISAQAFLNCVNISSLDVPIGTELGNNALSGCSGLTELKIDIDSLPENSDGYKKTSALFGYSVVKMPQKQWTLVIKGSPDTIPYNAFAATNFSYINIPDTVTTIEDNAFQYCSYLKEVNLPNSITSIGESAFLGCSSLTSFTVPNSIDKIPDYCFYGCTNLSQLNMPQTVTEIGKWCFYNCTALNDISFSKSLKIIGEGAFYNCSSLEELYLYENIQALNKQAFSGCNNLSKVTILNEDTWFYTDFYYRVFNKNANITFYSVISSTTESYASKYGYNFVAINSCGHIGTQTKNSIEPTCCEKGYSGDIYCAVCDIKLGNGTDIAPTGLHVDADGEWEHDESSHYHTCYYCTKFDITAHTGGTATCTEKAICDICGAEYGDYADHKNTEIRNKVEATCSTEGYSGDRYCLDCGEKISTGYVIIPTGNHTDADGEWETSDTHHFHTCECGELLDIEAHYGGTATCNSRRICTVCGEEYWGYDFNNHCGDTEIRNAKAATCYEDGYTGDTYCLGCGEIIENGVVIKAAHNLYHNDYVAPTTETEGNIEYWYCETCGKYFSDAEGITEIPFTEVIINKIETLKFSFYDDELLIEYQPGIFPEGCLSVDKIVPPPEEIVDKAKNTFGNSTEVLAYYEIKRFDNNGNQVYKLDYEITIKTKLPEEYQTGYVIKVTQEDDDGNLVVMDSWREGEYICYKTNWLEKYE